MTDNDYLILEEEYKKAKWIDTKYLLNYLKWRVENNIFKLKIQVLPHKFKKIRVKYGIMYISMVFTEPENIIDYDGEVTDDEIRYLDSILIIYKTKTKLTSYKISMDCNA